MKNEETSGSRQKNIDWTEVHRRMEAARASAERGWAPTAEARTKTLRQRASLLAREETKEDPGQQIEIVEFLLGYERYGVESFFVREVYPLKDLTPVPCTPSHVLGIINVRGQILSIIDLKKFFDLPDKGLGDLNRVIILKTNEMEFGVLADVILGVRPFARDKLQQAMPTLTGIREDYLKGIAPDRTIILDCARILSDRGIVVNEEVKI